MYVSIGNQLFGKVNLLDTLFVLQVVISSFFYPIFNPVFNATQATWTQDELQSWFQIHWPLILDDVEGTFSVCEDRSQCLLILFEWHIHCRPCVAKAILEYLDIPLLASEIPQIIADNGEAEVLRVTSGLRDSAGAVKSTLRKGTAGQHLTHFDSEMLQVSAAGIQQKPHTLHHYGNHTHRGIFHQDIWKSWWQHRHGTWGGL